MPFCGDIANPGLCIKEFGSSVTDAGDIILKQGQTLSLSRELVYRERSYTFEMTSDQQFSLEGIIVENDGNQGTSQVFFGGFEGVQADDGTGQAKRAVFVGSELLRKESSVIDLTFNFGSSDNVHYDAFGNIVSVGDPANDQGNIKGSVTAYLVIERLGDDEGTSP